MASASLSRAANSVTGIPLLKAPARTVHQVAATRLRQVCRAAVDENDTPAPVPYYTGYIKKDSAGISVIDVVEPTVYVAGSGSSLEKSPNSVPAIIGAVLALAGAAAALSILSANSPVVDDGASLSELVQKFSAEVGSPVLLTEVVVEAAAPSLTVEETAPPEEAEQVESVTVVEAVIVEAVEQPIVATGITEPESTVVLASEPEESSAPAVVESPEGDETPAVEDAPAAE